MSFEAAFLIAMFWLAMIGVLIGALEESERHNPTDRKEKDHEN